MPSARSDAYSVFAFPTPDGLSRVHDMLDRLRNDHPEIAARDRLSFRTAVAELVATIRPKPVERRESVGVQKPKRIEKQRAAA